MPQPPLVSIVTPVLNGARFLPDCLRSVRDQTYPHVEHLVIDGGSADGTLDLLAAAPGIRYVTGRDAGMYDALRRGFELARGEVFAYQNADDRYAHPEALTWAVDFLAAHPEADLVWGNFRWIDAHGHVLAGHRQRFPPRHQDAIRRHNYVPPHATFVRAHLVRHEGLGPDPTFRYAGDWEWFLRIHRAGKRFAHLDRVLADFRLHTDAQTASVPLTRKMAEWRRLCRRHQTSFALACWNELFWMPLRYRTATRRAS